MENFLFIYLKNNIESPLKKLEMGTGALISAVQWLEYWSMHQSVMGSTLANDMHLDCRFDLLS